MNVSNREHREHISILRLDIFQVIGDIDRDEDTASKSGDTREEPSEHT